MAFKSLADIRPDIVDSWSEQNGFSPHDISYGSGRKIYCKCKCGYQYSTTPNSLSSRKEGTGCRVCSKERQQESFRKRITERNRAPRVRPINASLVHLFAEEYKARGQERGVLVKCPDCGMEWRATISEHGCTCPYCSSDKDK